MSGSITPQQLAQLLDRHAAALELYARQWTHAPEDCVQDAFVQLLRQPAVPDNAGAWLFRVVRNRALSTRRSDMRRTKHEQRAAVEQPGCFVSAAGPLDADEVARALEMLPGEQREIVVARIWGELTLQQVAEVVQLPRSTVHRRYHEALATLRKQLGDAWTIKNHTTA